MFTVEEEVLVDVYPLVMTNIAMENGPVEIVDLPIQNDDVSWLYMLVYR